MPCQDCGCEASAQYEMRVRGCGGVSHICGLGGDDMPDPTKRYTTKIVSSHWKVYHAGGEETECELTITSTQTKDSYEEGDPLLCEPEPDEAGGSCEGIPVCDELPWDGCRDFDSSGDTSYSGEKPPAPAPATPCGDWSEWGPTFETPIPTSDFRRGERIYAGGALDGSFLAASYTSHSRSYHEYEFRRVIPGTVRIPAKVVATLRQFLTGDPFGFYTEWEEEFVIPADGSSVIYTVPMPSANGTVLLWRLEYILPAPSP